MQQRIYTHLLVIIVLLLLTGCATSVRNPGSLDTPQSFGSLQLFQTGKKAAELPEQATISGSAVIPHNASREHNVLVLSGGGSDGAFGAGVLAGWTKSGMRPKFTIVTGVSTGALLSNFAFLGKEWDGAMKRFYTNVSDEKIYTSRGVAGLLQDSLYDTEPLKKLLAKVVNYKMLDAVAAEHRKGRRLYVATTDLDLGRIVVWDMGGIAASKHKDRLQLYRDILLASTAIPGLFKPVYISNQKGGAHMHVDGGVKAPVLLRTFMIKSHAPKRKVYVLINGHMSLNSGGHKAVKATFKNIAQKSISELIRGLQYKTTYQAYVTTRQSGAAFNITYIPDSVPGIADALRFNPKEMRKLFRVGERLGSNPGHWKKEPPRLEKYERVSAN